MLVQIIAGVILAALCIFFATKYFLLKGKLVTLTDNLPEKPSARNCWLKLQDTGKEYITKKDGKVYLTVLKK